MEENRRFYEKIAADFSRTRETIWEEFNPLLKYVQDGYKILDLGCGNGRLLSFLEGKQIDYVGVDNSKELLALAAERYPDKKFILSDGINLSFGDNSFDMVWCLAVFHHLPGKELRLMFLKEVYRVLKPGGRVLISVWYLWPTLKHWRTFLKYFFLKIFGFSSLDFGDVYKNWGKIGKRFIHNFSKKELKDILEEVGFLVEEVFFLARSSGEKNLIIIGKK